MLTTKARQLRSDLRNLRNGLRSITDFVVHVRDINEALVFIGDPVPLCNLIEVVLDALPEDYDPIVAAINSKGDLCSLDELESSLFAHESRLETNRKVVITEPISVNMAQAPSSSVSHSTKHSGSNSTSEFPTSTSHVTANTDTHGTSSLGGRHGHGGGRYGRGGGRFGKVPSPRASFNPYTLAPRPSFHPSFGYPPTPRPTPPRQQQPQAFLVGSDPSFNNQWWYSDSGASHHVTPDASNVSDASSLSGAEQVFMGNGQGLSINSVGSMNFPLSNYSNSSLILNSLLLVPHITKNLMSVSKLAQDNHIFFEFHPQFCLVKSQDSFEVLLSGTVGAGGLYRFVNPSSPSSSTPS
ncbi:hypothetical protein KIW84_031788 [Lathyrus oleraceus]|uniref:Retrovirus-related Pol polyprotein from transposon TNT 1-94-like beta-barrel domain-containing protein n=1 Tax=Pisum sativum TaxID=3888 RepID=A0A9D5B1B4_PEA|nr:hypothetical protein KIW84_031788 [Pisum sativum]